jgi:DNA-binding NarL/FixJ family response regulator
MNTYRPAIIEDLRREVQDTTQNQRDKNALRSQLLRDPAKELFVLKPADQWLKEACSYPEARQLLGTLWHENELCILFADTNIGKSIFAVQIGYGLAKQCGPEPFGSQVNEALKVLYVDFELSSLQFKIRYSHPQHGQHHFGDNFIRAEFNPGGDDPQLYDKYEDYVQQKLDHAIKQTKANVLIIDNITCMGSATHYAGGALPLMKTLKNLKTKYNLSMLVLAHTPKRNASRPITVNDLQGSKMLINFADSAFALGQSQQDANLRYVKQVKQRNTHNDYGANHICLFRIEKQRSFLSFEFVGFDNEQAHLQKQPGTSLSEEVKQRIAELNRQGLSLRQVADHLKVGVTTVRRVLGRMKEGEVGEK